MIRKHTKRSDKSPSSTQSLRTLDLRMFFLRMIWKETYINRRQNAVEEYARNASHCSNCKKDQIYIQNEARLETILAQVRWDDLTSLPRGDLPLGVIYPNTSYCDLGHAWYQALVYCLRLGAKETLTKCNTQTNNPNANKLERILKLVKRDEKDTYSHPPIDPTEEHTTLRWCELKAPIVCSCGCRVFWTNFRKRKRESLTEDGDHKPSGRITKVRLIIEDGWRCMVITPRSW